MTTPVIELRNVGCKAGYRYLLKNVSWTVNPGEHWVVFGMNGSGKTTLLSIIAGFKHFTEGTVKINGEGFSNENMMAIRKKIGWVSSSFFDKHYTKESALNIVLSGLNGSLGLSTDLTLNDVRLAKMLLRELHLGDMMDRPFDMLSKGERQNVLIARALITNPEILILDEPCTGLDVYNRSYLFETLKDLSSRKDLTIIYVTHYVEEIQPMFDKALLLKGGHVFSTGATDDMFTESEMERLLGYPVQMRKEEDGTFRMHVKTESHLAALLEGGAFHGK